MKILFVLMILCGGVHLLLNFLLYRGWHRLRPPRLMPSALPPLTVLIAARDEAHNLQRYLPTILSQAYPTFEVLVMLNQTTDASEAVLQDLGQQHPHLRWQVLYEIPPDWSPKKWAIQQGVAAAGYDHLALIDADCEPESGWLQGIGQRFAQGYEVILGLGFYRPFGGLLSRFIQFETWYTAWQYVGAAAWGKPYMGVGRNLAYTREFFQRHGGLTRWQDSLSGDDDLLIGAYAPAANTTAMKDPRTFTWSEPPIQWRSWWQQKNRHLSASHHYPLIIKALLGFFHFSHLVFYGLLILFCVVDVTALEVWGLYISVLGGKMMMMWAMYQPKKERPLPFTLIGLDLSYFLYNLSIVPLGLIKRPAWKSRIPEYPKIHKKTGS